MPELYKLKEDAKPGEIGGPPFILGSFLRFPSISYPKWGVFGDDNVLYERSLTTYQDEFAETSPAWMESVVEAAKRGGIENRPQMLRDKVGRTAAILTEKMLKDRGKVHVLDIGCGAGGSLLAYVKELQSKVPDYAERVVVTGVDFSRGSLWKAEDDLEAKGLVSGSSLYIVHSRDVDMLSHVEEASQDIVINVAGIHANAFLEKPMRSIAGVLKPGGYFVSGDWHHRRWLEPSLVYAMFDRVDPSEFDWKNKGAFMDEFKKMVPAAAEKIDLSSWDPADIKAVEEIENYWMKGWASVRREKIKAGVLKPTDEQIMSEGHVPVEHYVKYARACGMELDKQCVENGILDGNPFQVVPGTNLNMVAVFRKRGAE